MINRIAQNSKTAATQIQRAASKIFCLGTSKECIETSLRKAKITKKFEATISIFENMFGISHRNIKKNSIAKESLLLISFLLAIKSVNSKENNNRGKLRRNKLSAPEI